MAQGYAHLWESKRPEDVWPDMKHPHARRANDDVRPVPRMRPAAWGRALLVACTLLATGRAALAQTPVTPAPTATAASTSAEAPEWEFSASVFGYFVPDDRNYAQPSFTADRDWLHLEARYNYEDQDTGSAWFGYNVAGGEAVRWELTPMVASCSATRQGLRPAIAVRSAGGSSSSRAKASTCLNAGDSSDSFFYNWSELALAPVDWLRIGMATQRTRAYRSEREIQRGFLVGASFKRMDATLYVLTGRRQTDRGHRGRCRLLIQHTRNLTLNA